MLCCVLLCCVCDRVTFCHIVYAMIYTISDPRGMHTILRHLEHIE